jgi:hypothetical protein
MCITFFLTTSYAHNFDPTTSYADNIFLRRVMHITLTLPTSYTHNFDPHDELFRYFFPNDKFCT